MHRVPALKSLRKAREKGGKPSEIMAAEIPGEKHGVFIICVLKGKHFWDNRSAQSGRDSESSARRHLLVAQLAEPPGWARARARGAYSVGPLLLQLCVSSLRPSPRPPGAETFGSSGWNSNCSRASRQSVSHFPGSVLGVENPELRARTADDRGRGNVRVKRGRSSRGCAEGVGRLQQRCRSPAAAGPL